jgi:small subunit ribosomal protein S17
MRLEMAEKVQGNRRTLVGTVVSDRMDKTIAVRVDRKTLHRRYRKYITRTKKYLAHDEENLCQVGDKVEIVEGRPLSKRKRWVLKRQLAVRVG